MRICAGFSLRISLSMCSALRMRLFCRNCAAARHKRGRGSASLRAAVKAFFFLFQTLKKPNRPGTPQVCRGGFRVLFGFCLFRAGSQAVPSGPSFPAVPVRLPGRCKSSACPRRRAGGAFRPGTGRPFARGPVLHNSQKNSAGGAALPHCFVISFFHDALCGAACARSSVLVILSPAPSAIGGASKMPACRTEDSRPWPQAPAAQKRAPETAGCQYEAPAPQPEAPWQQQCRRLGPG